MATAKSVHCNSQLLARGVEEIQAIARDCQSAKRRFERALGELRPLDHSRRGLRP